MNVSTVTTDSGALLGALLGALRGSLRHADHALLCVAFVSDQGVHLLDDSFKRLGDHARILVTTVFGSTSPTALNTLDGLGAQVRVLNPSGGSYHPKLYLANTDTTSVAVIGSANLTGGLVTNREVAAVMRGERNSEAIADAWSWAEGLWSEDRVVPWQRAEKPEPATFEATLLACLQAEVARESVFLTLGRTPKPNRVVEVTPHGLYVETESSRAKGNPAQLIPAWMLSLAWDYLRRHGALTNKYLLASDGLSVKRSSAVCAILSRLPGVEVVEGGAVELCWRA